MDDVNTISLYQALAEMRKLTAMGRTFSFTHVTYNRHQGSTNGIRQVRKARLRPAAKDDDVVNSQYKLFYYEEDSQQPRNCWQMLILFFNGKKVVLD
ncbi:MAG: hypothetical protein ACOYMF_05260 [Bacteroidales bacterium]